MSQPSQKALIADFLAVRAATEALAAPLSPEDQQLQSMPSCSPVKWHRAHTTWFFETFLLAPHGQAVAPQWSQLFNSYYEALGTRHARDRRGMLSRPTAAEVGAYRRTVDGRIIEWLSAASTAQLAAAVPIIRLGLAHEEQHQELLLTDILNAFADNPLEPAYRAHTATVDTPAVERPLRYVEYDGGLYAIGAKHEVFAFDHEGPRHQRWLEPFALAERLLTVAEMKAFIADRGYTTPSLWLSEGLDLVRQRSLSAPLYAQLEGGAYLVFGLDGLRIARDDEPVTHLSFYEADALARWLGARLPTEAEWEVAAARCPVEGNFVEHGALRARPAPRDQAGPAQLFGDAWEWTRSAFEPYPGFTPAEGALGEYNGKFMVSQLVLRGGSWATPRAHMRASYRNFWPPDTRFQVSGVRLAKDL